MTATRLDSLPVAHRDLVDRPRLLDVMTGRFDRPLTIVTAGAGFGKSTLLAQAVHDPVATGRGIDVFHRVSEHDSDAPTLLGALIERLTGETPIHPTVDLLVDAMWSESPHDVNVMLDDIHQLTDRSESWAALDELIRAMPQNGHLVLSGRGRLNVKVSRHLASGAAVEITEGMLAFDAAELDVFARLRAVDRDRLGAHGWPALAELAAHSNIAGAHRFVSEEVLAELAPERVEALRLLAVHTTIDDELVAAVTSSPLSAAQLVAGLPLTSSTGSDVFVLHDLWRDLLTAPLSHTQRCDALRSTARVLLRRGALRDACEVALHSGDLDVVREVLLEFTRDIQLVHSVADRNALTSAMPPELANSPEVLLLRADAVFASEPTRAEGEMRRAIEAAKSENRGEIQVLALLRLGELGYRSGDVSQIEQVQVSLRDLATTAVPGAEAGHALLDVWRLMLENAPAKALGVMRSPSLQSYEPIAALVDYYRAVQHGHAGHCQAALTAIDDLRRTPHGRILNRLGGFVSIMKWYMGQLNAHDRAGTVRLLDAIGKDRQVHLYVEGTATVALYMASAGDTAAARSTLAEAVAHRDRVPEGAWGPITVELATAVLELMDGDEAAAAARLEAVVPPTGPFAGFARHVFGNVGALIYVLVPRTRHHFDAEETGPDLRIGTSVGAALVALRERGQVEPAARLPWDELSRLRTWAYEPHLAELALGAVAGGTLRAGDALDGLLHSPRATLRSIAERHGDAAVGKLALARLAITPERPSTQLRISVLGPLAVHYGASSMHDSAPMRRKMVRELLMLLVHRRRIRRAEVVDLLWPDKDEAAGNNNLRATLMHLRTLLEQTDLGSPESKAGSDADTRPESTPPWHIRSDGDHLSLFESDLLWIDADEFSRTLDNARSADRHRHPAEALAHYQAATNMYHGEYLGDALDPDWAYHHRMRLHLDAVEAAIRASELLTAQGSTAEAGALAVRAIDAEPLSEPAHRALVRALLVGGDRAGAARAHRRVLEILNADGLSPDDATMRLGAKL